jgi:hypothetical protein
VPASWVTTESKLGKRGIRKQCYTCWWPDEENDLVVKNLIRNHSDPDTGAWKRLKGKSLGIYYSLEDAARALRKRDGTAPTVDEEDRCSTPLESQSENRIGEDAFKSNISTGNVYFIKYC